MLTQEQLNRLEADFSLETFKAIQQENESQSESEPLNCASAASTTIERSKVQAVRNELLAQSHSPNAKKDRDFLFTQANLRAAKLMRPELANFIDEIGHTARNNPALKLFSYLIACRHAR